MIIKEDLQAFTLIARQRQYGLNHAMADLTGVGTLYSIGSDLANKERLEKMVQTTENISAFNAEVKGYLSSTNTSLLSRVTYLTSLAAAGAGHLLKSQGLFRAGVTGAAILATLFFIRAGYNATDQSSIEQMLTSLASSQKEKTV